jgi:hypothetical protein
MDNFEKLIVLAGGRITCLRCTAKSKRTKHQCRGPAVCGWTVCRFHGARGGPKTAEGRQRCAEARSSHGRETRAKREERSLKSAELAVLESIGRMLHHIEGPRTRGRKPARMSEVHPELQAWVRELVRRQLERSTK